MNIRKSKLAKELSKDHPRAKYVPDAGEVKLWFKIINREIFDGALNEFEDIIIRRMHKQWAEYTGKTKDNGLRYGILDLNHHMLSKKHLIGVIGHEMVHHYQWTEEFPRDIPEHGNSFWKWKPKFAKVGITLAECQRHPK